MSENEKCQCGCGEDADLEQECECESESKCSTDCDETCECSKNCNCGDNCECSEDSKCCDECECSEKLETEDSCDCEEQKEEQCCEHKDYLKDLLRVQAEFDNYRKRMSTALSEARNDGFMNAIEQFLPAIDSFKMATDMITDSNTLMGIKFIEKGILETLAKMGVEAIDATGEFNPEFHQAIDTDDKAEVESGMIVKEVYKGFIYKGKVIRYSQVIVKR